MTIENRRGDHIERHIVTIICSLTAIGVVWIGSSIIDLKTTVAGLSEKFALRTEITALQSEVARISAEQARRTAIIDSMRRGMK